MRYVVEPRLQMTRTYLELRTALMRFAYRYFKTSQEIEDVVQEAFVKVIEAQQKREILHPKSYIYQTVKNLSLKRLDTSDYRLTDTAGDILPESVLLESATLEDQFESQQRFELFCQAVRQLPVKCQRVYIMRRVCGYSQKQIAEKMGITVTTIHCGYRLTPFTAAQLLLCSVQLAGERLYRLLQLAVSWRCIPLPIRRVLVRLRHCIARATCCRQMIG